MCHQPDYEAQMRAFDDALLGLFREWAAVTAEHVDGADIGPQDWDAEFLREVSNRLPELKKSAEYNRLVRLLDALAGTTPTTDDAPGHADPLT